MRHKAVMFAAVLLALVLVIGALPIVAAPEASTIEVSGAVHDTTNNEYDRNPSIIFDGADYWLFFTKGDDTSTSGVRGTGYNPDGDRYVVYYKKAPNIAGLAGAAETKLALSDDPANGGLRPPGFDQRVVSAAVAGGNVYAFVSSGFGAGADHGLYYYVYTAGVWAGPILLVPSAPGGAHVNVVSDGTTIYIVWEAVGSTSEFYSFTPPLTLTGPTPISTDNQPKITLMGGALYVVSVEDGSGDIEVYTAPAGPAPVFAPHSTAIPGAGLYDPCIFNDGVDLYVVSAPYDGGNDQQWLVQTRWNGVSWATARRVSLGGYGGTYWWDYWPVGYWDGSDLYVFFTTETDNGPFYSDAEIAHVKMDWNLDNDHYFFIRNAVEQAVAGDTINVAAGTYPEGVQVHIDKNLSIVGADRTTTVITPKGDTGSSGDARGWFLVDSGVDFDLSNVTFDGSGYLVHQGIRTQGSGQIDNVAFTEIKYNESGPTYAGLAVVVFGAGNVDISNSVFSEIGRVGVLYYGAGITGSTYEDNTYTGKGSGDWLDYALDISAGAVVDVIDNTVTGCQGVASSDGSTSAGVMATTLYGAGTRATVTGNFLNGNTVGIVVGYDSSDTSTVIANDNDLSGNDDAGVSTTAPQVDASGNWWGDSTAAGVAAEVDGAVDYTPWLHNGTDTSGDPGFQGDFSHLHVDDDSVQTGSSGYIQEGIDLVTASTVDVEPGTYAESVLIDKALTLNGAGAGNPTSGRTAGSGAESIIDAGGLPVAVTIKASNVTLDGFDITGDASTFAGLSVYASTGSGDLATIDVLNSFFHGMGLPNPYSGYYVTSYGIHSVGDDVGGTRRTITDLAIQGNEFYDLGGVASGADTSAGAGVWLNGIQGGGGGGGALISGNSFHDIHNGFNSGVPGPEFGVGVAVIDDGDGVPDTGALVTGNTYADVFGGVVMYITGSDVDESGSDFAGVTTLVMNTGNLATVNEANLAPYAKTDKPTGFPGSTAYFALIQDAVDYSDPGATVSVSAGTFVEQVDISKDLTLVGAGSSSIIRSPATLAACFTTSADNKPVVCAHSAPGGDIGLTVQDLLVDGDGQGNDNSRFSGIAYYNAHGAVSNVVIENVRDTPFSGAQHGVGLYAYNDDGTPRTLNVSGCNVADFQKTGIALNGDNLTANVSSSTVTGAGATSVTAQNGIQIGYGAGGSVTGCTVSGIAYIGPIWGASGMLFYNGTTVNVGGSSSVSASQGAIVYQETDGSVDGVTISAGDVDGAEGISIRDYGYEGFGEGQVDRMEASPLEEPAWVGGTEIEGADTTVTIANADLTGTRSTRDDDYGIAVWALGDNVQATVTDSYLQEWSIGFVAYESGSVVDVTAHDNCVENNDFGFWTNAAAAQDATINWWGDASGPYHPTLNPTGLGDEVSDNVTFYPWLNACGGTVVDNFWNEDLDIYYSTLQSAVDAASPGHTIVAVGIGPFGTEGHATIDKELTLLLNGRTFGPASPAFTIAAANVTIQGPGTLDGWDGSANSTDPAILVLENADNFILQDAEIKRWADGVELVGDVLSFKIVSNWIHSNTDAGLQIDNGAALGGVITIEGNLFKVNGGNGVQNDGDTIPLDATYNSWGDLAGPTGPDGDGVGSNVTYDPWTFSELFLDMEPDTEAIEVDVVETDSFDVAVKLDAERLYGVNFKITYDTAWLTLNSTNFVGAWSGRCASLDVPPVLGMIRYRCSLEYPDGEYNADGGTVATFNFTAAEGPSSEDGPWATDLDIAHEPLDTSTAAIGGVKVFVNNAGYNDPSVGDRDITDPEDGRVNIIGRGQYTGFVDLESRANDSGATLEVYESATYGSTLLASGDSASSGQYTTSWVGGNRLLVGTTHWLLVDRELYLPTTVLYYPPASPPPPYNDYAHSAPLTSRLTGLPLVYLKGGDATDNNKVDINDATCIGWDYDSAVSTCLGEDPANSPSSDVNGSGYIDLFDLVLMGSNYTWDQSPWAVP